MPGNPIDPSGNSNHQGDTTLTSRLSGETHTFLPGDVVDGAYKLTHPLGQGGMGVVFACQHVGLDRSYAIKILSGESLNEESWTRFRAEAQALAKLNHPGIVRVHNMGIDGKRFPYFVMDLLEGQTLDQILVEREYLSINDTLDIFIQVADALSTAHNQGIVHRDIKPSNLMLCVTPEDPTARVKIVDFGIARLSIQGFNAQTQTATGLVFGTPYYMSPEQCQGARVDERTDIYSMGCALYETLTGKLPFQGENAFQTFMLHQTQDMPSLSSSLTTTNFAPSLEKALEKMLAKKPADRYQNVGQLKLDLERIRAGKSIIVQGVTYATPNSEQQSQTRTRLAPEENSEAEDVKTTQRNTGLRQTGRNTSRFEQRNTFIGGENLEQDDHEGDDEPERRGLSAPLIVLCAAGGLLAIGAIIYGAYHYFTATSDLGTSKIASIETEANDILNYNYEEFKTNEDKLYKDVAAYRESAAATAPFRQGDPPAFVFPNSFILCLLRFDNEAPIFGIGNIPIPLGKRITFMFANYTENWIDILKKFGPYDLNGIELITKKPLESLKLMEKWQNLDELSFWNTAIKALPKNEARYDETELTDDMLPAIDKFTRLKTLGLSGPTLSGEAVAKMHLLDTVQTLKLKRISDLDELLPVVAEKDNITELWIVSEHLTDASLTPLLKMKNLQTLRIRRSGLTLASIEYFKKMPALKTLYLDKNLSAGERAEFKKQLPAYDFETTTDMTYWKMFPEQLKEHSP